MPSQTQTEAIIVGVFVALAVLIAAPIDIWRATRPQQARTAIVLEGGLSVFPRPRLTDDDRSRHMRYMRYMRRVTRASRPSPARQTCRSLSQDTRMPSLQRSDFGTNEEYCTYLVKQGDWSAYKVESEQTAKLTLTKSATPPAGMPNPPREIAALSRSPFWPAGPNTPDYGTVFEDIDISDDSELDQSCC
jgi:hypothetical protein